VQHRFRSEGELHEHSLGNLLIVALWELLGDSVAGLDWVARLLGVQGRVLPMSVVPLDIEARGRVPGCRPARRRLALCAVRSRGDDPGRVRGVRLLPENPPACPQAVEAVLAADWVVLGPGSWFTSVLPHLLVPDWRRPAHHPARKLLVLNLRRSPARPTGSRRPSTSRCSPGTQPDLSSTSCCADSAGSHRPRGPRGRGGGSSVPRSSWPRWPVTTTPTSTTRTVWRPLSVASSHLTGTRVTGSEPMAMTAAVKDELARLTVTRPCCRKAEVSSMLRFAGGLHIVSGRIVVEAEVDTGATARRLRKDIAEVYGHTSDVAVVAPGGLRRGSRYLVRVAKDGEALARQTGLLDGRGRPVRGLPPQVVSGALCDAESAWRGAFLAHGSLTEPGRSSALEITCPGPEAALALVGAARRLGISAKAREVRGSTGSSSVTATRSAPADRLGARTAGSPGRSGGCAARCEPRRTGWRTSTTPTCAARPGPRSPRAPRPARPGDPRRRHPGPPAGRGRAPAGAQAGKPRGARHPGRPADDQGRVAGRIRGCSPGRQAGRRPGHPGT
jgi:hypothetical protein